MPVHPSQLISLYDARGNYVDVYVEKDKCLTLTIIKYTVHH